MHKGSLHWFSSFYRLIFSDRLAIFASDKGESLCHTRKGQEAFSKNGLDI